MTTKAAGVLTNGNFGIKLSCELGEGAKKKQKKLTSVSFAFTHTYTLEKLTRLLFSPKRT